MFYLIFLQFIFVEYFLFERSKSLPNAYSTNINFDIKGANNNKYELFDNLDKIKAKIYLPEYQNKYSRINELNDSNFDFTNLRNNQSVTVVPRVIIEGNHFWSKIQKISKKTLKI